MEKKQPIAEWYAEARNAIVQMHQEIVAERMAGRQVEDCPSEGWWQRLDAFRKLSRLRVERDKVMVAMPMPKPPEKKKAIITDDVNPVWHPENASFKDIMEFNTIVPGGLINNEWGEIAGILFPESTLVLQKLFIMPMYVRVANGEVPKDDLSLHIVATWPDDAAKAALDAHPHHPTMDKIGAVPGCVCGICKYIKRVKQIDPSFEGTIATQFAWYILSGHANEAHVGASSYDALLIKVGIKLKKVNHE